jgi:hypothetical protein
LSSIKSKEKWTAIGVTVETKDRFVAMKQTFEKMLDQGSKTWDYFLNALLDLGPLTWNFLITETVKGIRAAAESCPFPGALSSEAIED